MLQVKWVLLMIVMLLSPRPTRIYKSDQVQISPMCVALTSKLSVSPWKQPSTTVRSSLDVLALVCSSSCAIKTCLTLREYFFILAGKDRQILPSVWLMACWAKEKLNRRLSWEINEKKRQQKEKRPGLGRIWTHNLLIMRCTLYHCTKAKNNSYHSGNNLIRP